MQTVSFETAKRLKEAGFPQPEKWNPGQVWFEENMYAPSPHFFIWSDCIPGCDDEIRFFAATATDLIPPNWMLVRRVSECECVSEYELDNFFSNNIAPENYFHHDNPAEAAAMAWLYVNKK